VSVRYILCNVQVCYLYLTLYIKDSNESRIYIVSQLSRDLYQFWKHLSYISCKEILCSLKDEICNVRLFHAHSYMLAPWPRPKDSQHEFYEFRCLFLRFELRQDTKSFKMELHSAMLTTRQRLQSFLDPSIFFFLFYFLIKVYIIKLWCHRC